jgi:hypothetical protein
MPRIACKCTHSRMQQAPMCVSARTVITSQDNQLNSSFSSPCSTFFHTAFKPPACVGPFTTNEQNTLNQLLKSSNIFILFKDAQTKKIQSNPITLTAKTCRRMYGKRVSSASKAAVVLRRVSTSGTVLSVFVAEVLNVVAASARTIDSTGKEEMYNFQPQKKKFTKKLIKNISNLQTIQERARLTCARDPSTATQLSRMSNLRNSIVRQSLVLAQESRETFDRYLAVCRQHDT